MLLNFKALQLKKLLDHNYCWWLRSLYPHNSSSSVFVLCEFCNFISIFYILCHFLILSLEEAKLQEVLK